jgi:hypothetical protein
MLVFGECFLSWHLGGFLSWQLGGFQRKLGSLNWQSRGLNLAIKLINPLINNLTSNPNLMWQLFYS